MSFTETVLLALSLNIAAAFIIYLARVAKNYIADYHGLLSGEWIARHLSDGQIVKVDLIICHHRGDRITGSVNRMSPMAEETKKWKFTGAFREGRTVGYYWPDEGQYQTGSFGVFLMKKGGPVLEGYYFQSKTEFIDRRDGVRAFDRDGHERFRLRWQRLNRKRTPLWARMLWYIGFKDSRKRKALEDPSASDEGGTI